MILLPPAATKHVHTFCFVLHGVNIVHMYIRRAANETLYPALADTLSHLSSLRVLYATCLHITFVQLPQVSSRLSIICDSVMSCRD
jgi:hypothetical protein